ncbi:MULTISPECIES: response regulator transcription factor [unclassified Brevundimonas]|uniref:response regulator transcription factor n=1 Tax=unclassified Brevundimonas TaxID=2622653 RepID=UPI000CFDFF20|nr:MULTISPECIES: response regulator transcription factor [unclassified Brevundimonas]PQZ84830.1 hypothetical protein CQ026_00895 [Brevundimonas sp. MYb31]PRB36649.1 hypothetical protein CQ035_05540 [Brevundimonas sp. MYb46]
MLLTAPTTKNRSTDAKSPPLNREIGRLLLLDLSDKAPTGLGEYLEKSGFAVFETTSLDAICDDGQPLSDLFNLIILVASLPHPSAFGTLRQLNRADAPPIFIVAVEGEALERVLMLEMGVDDLVGPEANAREILARLNRIIYRKTEKPNSSSSKAAWTLRHAQRILIAPSGQRIGLTGRDHELLIALSDHADGVLMDCDFHSGQMRTAISRLKRKALMDAQIVLPIENVWGRGYRFDAPLIQA